MGSIVFFSIISEGVFVCVGEWPRIWPSESMSIERKSVHIN